jgi:hypothetical protein
VIGFDRRSAREPFAARFYSERIPVGEGGHVIDKNLRLAAAAGAATDAREFPLSVPPSRALDEIRRTLGAPFAVLNSGATFYSAVDTLEREVLDRANRLGIGPQGYGGDTTAFGIHILTYPCHITSLPVAVTIECHAHRHKEVTL